VRHRIGSPALLGGIDRAVFAPGSAHRVACLRIALVLIIGLRLITHQWWSMSGRPAELFRPVSVVSLLETVPSASALLLIEVIGLSAVVLCVLGKWTRPTFFTAWACLFLLAALHSSAGKIMHNEVLLLLASVPVLFAPGWARAWDRRHSIAAGWPPRLSLIVMATVYFMTGLRKLMVSGPEWVASDNLSWVLYAGAQSDQSLSPALAVAIAGTWLPPLVAGATLFLELGAPLLLWGRRTRYLFAAGIVGMHAGIGLLLGLDYSAWALTVIALVFPWDRLRRVTPEERATTRLLPLRWAGSSSSAAR
jgi:hypothetical protein